MLSRRRFLLSAGLATPFLFGGYAFGVEPLRLVVTPYRITPDRWPSGMSLRIAVVADIHAMNPWMSPSHIARIAAVTNVLKPDIVLLAGDYEASMPPYGIGSYVSMEDCAEALSILEAPLGVHAVLGNHDVGRRGNWGENVRRAFPAHGIPVMENEAPAILLAHEPDIFATLPRLDGQRRIVLTISGHTHGGQVSIPFYGPRSIPSRYGRRYAYGHVVEDDRHLVISAGLGMTGIPIRFGVPPEIVLITLGPAGPVAA